MNKKYIILDRDGVINYDSDEYIKSPQEWQPIPGSLEAIALLTQAGYKIAVASNQSGLARGYFNEGTLQAIHDKMHHVVQQAGGYIDFIVYCPHHPDDHCSCRKPNPGMLKQIAEHWQLDLTHIPFVGDNIGDIQAALAVAAQPILVRTGKGAAIAQSSKLPAHILIYDNLLHFVQSLLNGEISPLPHAQ